MINVTNQTRNSILTITGGLVKKGESTVIEDWEFNILQQLHGDKVFGYPVEETETKKKKTK